MKKIICWIKAIPLWLRCNAWVPHLYIEDGRKASIVAAGDAYFRETTSLEHLPGEQIYQKATIVTDRCKVCGKKIKTWYAGEESEIPILEVQK